MVGGIGHAATSWPSPYGVRHHGTSTGKAAGLARALGVTFEELDIRPAARLMLADLGHPFSRGEPVYDVTFENIQAGLRNRLPFPARKPARWPGARHR